MRKLRISRFWWCLGDAVLGVSSAVWQATQTRHNDAIRPPVPSKNGVFAISASLSRLRNFENAFYRGGNRCLHGVLKI